ncbi:MAG: type 4a pilus biogenesis protein PilO [Sedimentisphaerales bacterium]|nr:type 4a pilus biogenesis protein PilO [Sedimentisphaerales bacterium]
MFISRAKQQVIIIVSAVAVVAALVVLWYLPTRRKYTAVGEECTLINSVIRQASQKQNQMPQLEEKLESLKASLEKYDLALPADTQLGDFLGTVANLMNAYGLTEQQIAPQKEIETGQLNCIAVDMKCKGKLSQIRKFYQDIQHLNRAVRVEEFRLLNDSDLTGNINMETKVIIYYRSEQA